MEVINLSHNFLQELRIMGCLEKPEKGNKLCKLNLLRVVGNDDKLLYN